METQTLLAQPGLDPPRVSFELTNICNLHCSYCLRDEDSLYHTKANYFSVELLRRVIRGAREAYQSEYVSFTGGEVTLHPRFAERRQRRHRGERLGEELGVKLVGAVVVAERLFEHEGGDEVIDLERRRAFFFERRAGHFQRRPQLRVVAHRQRGGVGGEKDQRLLRLDVHSGRRFVQRQ